MQLKHLTWCRIDPEGSGLNSPQKSGDIGWDLEAAEDIIIPLHGQVSVPTNVRVKLPDDTWGEIRARSSIAIKGLLVEAGILDNGYTGPLWIVLRNMNHKQNGNLACDWGGNVYIKKGERIAQLVLHQAIWASGLEVTHIEDDPRRGNLSFGSTGI